MGIAFHDFIKEIELIAPRNLEEVWDNCGIQINMGNMDVNRVLIALEITKDVIEEANRLSVDFIITHHPLIFHNLKAIDRNIVTGNYVIELIKLGISVYSAHTTFDSAVGGNNDYMAELIGLEQIGYFQQEGSGSAESVMGRTGILKKPLPLELVCSQVCTALKIDTGIQMIGNPRQMIQRIGLCTGAGGDLLEMARRQGCDLFITGDVRYHDGQMAKEIGLCVIDAGHYGTEKIFAENFARKLKNSSGCQVELFESQINLDPFHLKCSSSYGNLI